jgi:hypothetical protein
MLSLSFVPLIHTCDVDLGLTECFEQLQDDFSTNKSPHLNVKY